MDHPPPIWYVRYPDGEVDGLPGLISDGFYDEAEAHNVARAKSIEFGEATVTGFGGQVVTYVNGRVVQR